MIPMEVSTIQSFPDYFSKIRERTMRVVACIPPDKIEWRAAAGKFTLGDLARHIAATERNVFAECACGGRNRYDGCGRELAAGRDEVVRFMERMHNESMNMLTQLSDNQLQQKCQSADGTPITTWKLLRSMVEHEVTTTTSAPPDQILCASTIASPAASVITPRISIIDRF